MSKLNSDTDITFSDGYFTTRKTLPTMNNKGEGGSKVDSQHYATVNAMMIGLCGPGVFMQCIVDVAKEAVKEAAINSAIASRVSKEKMQARGKS